MKHLFIAIAVVLFALSVSAQEEFLFQFKDAKGKYGFKDMMTNKVVIPAQYDEVGNFMREANLAWVKKNKKYGFIDNKGKLIVPLIYDFALDFTNGRALVNKGRHTTEDPAGYKPGKYGFIDKTDKEVIPLIYTEAEFFNEDRARVGNGEKVGFIDPSGKEVIPLIYDDADLHFKEGKVEVTLGEKTFFIDKNGKKVK